MARFHAFSGVHSHFSIPKLFASRFQRLLTEAAELPPLCRCLQGREASLKRRMAPYARATELLEHVHWASATAASRAAAAEDATEQLREARAEAQRWAQVATRLYELVKEP